MRPCLHGPGRLPVSSVCTPESPLESLCSPAQGESRLLREEVHRLTLELRERQGVLEKLRVKYETLRAKARTEDGEGLWLQLCDCPAQVLGPGFFFIRDKARAGELGLERTGLMGWHVALLTWLLIL